MAIRHSRLIKGGEDSLHCSCKGCGDVVVTREDIGAMMIEIFDFEAERRSWEIVFRMRA